jgi:hypothetical protein
MVSGAFAKAFRADVQPVEIASALQRELDGRAAIMGKGTTMVPNHFVVELSPHDFERLDMYAQTLGDELAEVVRDHADEQKYQLRGTVAVTFAEAADLDIGVHRIRSSVVAGVQSMAASQVLPAPERAGARAPAETTVLSGNRLPAPYLEVNGDRHPLARPVTVMGRGTQVDLRIDDAGVSRRHAEIRLGPPAVLVDLNSTNGTTVDGAPIGEYELADGSLIGIGETKLVFRLPAE